MLDSWERIHGYEEMVEHDFSHTYYCGRCGCRMDDGAYSFECPICHMIFSQRNETLLC